VRDGGEDLALCLAALARSASPPSEIIVVDDGCADDSAARAVKAGARVLRAGGRGPAAARNVGAQAASGEWLLFLDADCTVHPETLPRLAAAIAESPWASAVFGAYDDCPAAPGLVSQYRNLLHCHTHREGRTEASTFWSGCGAVRREAFLAIGGFDEVRFPRLGMEDIDFGYRLRDAGYRIRLDPRVEVTHLKRWTLRRMLYVDLFERGIPWTRLWLERGSVPADLAVGWNQRLSAVGALGLAAAPLAVMVSAGAAAGAVSGSFLLFLAANASLLAFLSRCRGAAFALAAVPLHWLHTLCAVASFAIGVGRHLSSGGKRPRAAGARSFCDP
jgi:GT2 family glycosyltransferase